MHSSAHLAEIDYQAEIDLELKRKTEFMFYQGEVDPTVSHDLVKRTLAVLDEHELNYTLNTEPELTHRLS